MTLEELRIVISASTEPLQKEIKDLKKQLNGMQTQTNKTTSGVMSSFKKMVAGVVALKIGQKIGESISNGIRDAMNVEASIQQIKRVMGESSNQFLKWADTQAIAFNMSKSEATKYGAVYGNLVSGFTSNTQETMNYTQQLLEASSIIASATGREMSDVMDRIRSGLLGNTEAIEDLGVNVNVAMIESTDAFKKFANGKSWDQLSFQTQQQIRLMAILEQTNKKYGDSINQNTSSSLQQLTAQLKNVGLSLGQAFLPILNIVIPILSQLVQYIAYAMNAVAQFSQALFGKPSDIRKQAQATSKQTQATTKQAQATVGLGNATEKAGKQAKGALAGFDEINSMNNSSDIAGSKVGTGGGPPITTGGQADPGNSDDENTSGILKNITDWANKIKKALSPVGKYVIDIKNLFTGFWKDIEPHLKPIIDFLEKLFKPVWEGIKDTVINVFQYIKEFISGALQVIAGIIKIFSALLTGDWELLWEGIKEVVFGVWEIISAWIEAQLNTLGIIFKAVLEGIIVLVEAVWNGIVSFVSSAWDKIVEIWNGVAEWFNSNVIQPLADIFNGLWNGIVTTFNDVKAWFTGKFTEAWSGIKDVFSGVGGFFSGVWNSITGTFSDMKGWFSRKFTEAWEAIKNVFSGVGGFFGGIWDIIKSKFTSIGSSIGDAMGGAFKAVVNTILGFAENTINGFLKAINNALGVINNIPGVKISKLNMLHIPKLARGGIIDSPTLAMVGEAGKEAVIPLENTSFVTSLAGALGNAVMSAMKFGQGNNGSVSGDGDIVIMVGGTDFGRVAINAINETQRQAGKTLLQV